MMKKLALVLALTITIVVLSATAEATLVVNKYTNDFTISSPNNEQIKACGCQTKVDPILIENAGNFYAKYKVTVLSTVAEWMTLSETEFQIAPKHRKEILNYINVPCGEIGTYDYTVEAVSSYGRVERLQRTVRADTCENLLLSVVPETTTANLCTPIHYSVSVKNTGTFPETYTISFGTYDQYVNMSAREVHLKPSQEYAQEAILTLPCTFYGPYDIDVTARGEKNRVEQTVTVHLDVENQFDHSILVETEQQLCSRVEQDVPVIVKNEIGVPNTFDITLEGPRFVDVKDHRRTLELEGNETKVMTLQAAPKEGDEGDYKLLVTVESGYGKVSKTREISLTVKNCYDFAIGMRNTDGEPIESDTSCCGYHEYFLNVRNRGQTEETYNVIVDGPSWFRSEELTLGLKPGENKDLRFFSQNPCVDQQYRIPVTVVLNRFPEVNETVVFTIDAQTQRTCHQVNIDDDEFTFTKGSESAIVPLIVEHNGSEGGIYDLSLDSELFSLVEKELTIFPGERQVIHLQPNGNITAYEPGRYISQPTLTLTQEKNPQLSEGIVYKEHVGTRLRGQGGLSRFWDWILFIDWGAPGFCGWMTVVLLVVLLLAVLLILLLFAGRLSGFRTGWDPVTLSVVKLVLLALVIVVFILMAIVKLPDRASLYEEPPQGQYFVVIEQDSIAYVDIAPYFMDPDKDILEYTVTQPKDIAVKVDGNILTLRPDPGFSGVNTMVVTARDQKGGFDDSPVLDIYVKQRKDLGFIGTWRLYCRQINLLLLLLLLLELLIVTFLCEKRIDDDEQELKPEPRYRALVTMRKRAAARKATVKNVAARKDAPKPAQELVRKTKPMSATRRRALDQALVSSETHEMLQVLKTHGKRGTEQNVERLQQAVRDFKKSPGYKPKNREQFYRYLKEKNVLRRLKNR